MRSASLKEIAAWADGEVLSGVPAERVSVVSSDTRALKGGEIFVALKGENFDAHDYLREAADKGVKALFIQHLPQSTEEVDCAIIRVKDTLKGLQEWARNYRRSLDLKVVGITGSSGKTSTKDLISAVLSGSFPVNATKGNLNNYIGLPLTILSTDLKDQVGVFEMGMSHPGEIEVLAEMAGPDIAVITNVGTAHLEFMGSREAIAQEKGMLTEAVTEDGWAILSAHDDFTESIRQRTRAQVVTGGIGCGDVQAGNVVLEMNGSRFRLAYEGEGADVSLSVPGEHMVKNATLAAAVGLKLGLSLDQVAQGLATVNLTKGRMEHKTVGGIPFLDDSYNANPDSMRAALQTMRKLPVKGKRIAVLGRMAELGGAVEGEHRKLGEIAAENEVDLVIGVGEEGEWIAQGVGNRAEVQIFDGHEKIAEYLRAQAGPEDLVLLKGSRSAKNGDRVELPYDH